jgi:Zn-dependent M28 family amino/carboxypeptidase
MRALLILLFAIVPAACRSARPAGPPKDVPGAMRARFAPAAGEIHAHARHLAGLNGRGAGSADEQAAADYLAAHMAELGLAPGAPRYLQEVPLPGGATSRNVIGVLAGDDDTRHLVLGAHIDHLGVKDGVVYPGADDNASGVAVLLGVAAAWARAGFRPHHTIVFVGFGAEEVGLVGSTYYVEHPARPIESLAAMINLDMLGRPRFYDYRGMALAKSVAGIADGPGLGLLAGGSSELMAIARCAVRASRIPSYAPEDFPSLRDLIDEKTRNRGDFAPFAARAVPFLFFSTSEHDDYHQPTDTLETIDAAMMRTAAEAVFRTTVALDLLPGRPAERPVSCPVAAPR